MAVALGNANVKTKVIDILQLGKAAQEGGVFVCFWFCFFTGGREIDLCVVQAEFHALREFD